jgi:hypothetical protein
MTYVSFAIFVGATVVVGAIGANVMLAPGS